MFLVCLPVHSSEHPYGLPDLRGSMRAKVEAGNSFALWVAHPVTKWNKHFII